MTFEEIKNKYLFKEINPGTGNYLIYKIIYKSTPFSISKYTIDFLTVDLKGYCSFIDNVFIGNDLSSLNYNSEDWMKPRDDIKKYMKILIKEIFFNENFVDRL